uniref:Uncharacterized protein n=1 Tax=Callorhinchus milii TaxID=7868 RepID=A0A4W3HFW5_CALMI
NNNSVARSATVCGGGGGGGRCCARLAAAFGPQNPRCVHSVSREALRDVSKTRSGAGSDAGIITIVLSQSGRDRDMWWGAIGSSCTIYFGGLLYILLFRLVKYLIPRIPCERGELQVNASIANCAQRRPPQTAVG